MKLKVIQNKELREDEIEVNTPFDETHIKRISNYISAFNQTIRVKDERKETVVFIDDIQYLEWVDKQVFLYTVDAMYFKSTTLQAIAQLLDKHSFVRISKTTVVNIHAIKHIEPYPNHRLLLQLISEEKLIVNRNYIKKLRDKIREETL